MEVVQRALIERTDAFGDWLAGLDWLLKLFFFLIGVMCLVLAADRHPPFELTRSYPAYGTPGGVVRLSADVRRDIDRRCSVDVWHYMIDGAGVRFPSKQDSLTAEAIREIERISPGKFLKSIEIPMSAYPGSGALVGVQNYRCNQIHALWPITVTTAIPFTIQ